MLLPGVSATRVASAIARGTDAGIRQRRQLHQPGAIGEAVEDVERNLYGQPRLADAPQSHDADNALRP